jgi:mannose-1-phosphate guanylyltransferase / phosphomannomutase
VVRRRVPTPWERKGAVMRQLVEATKGRRVDDTDGVKVFHAPTSDDGGPWGEDWVLVIPDTVEPVTHLWAEAGDGERTLALADEYEALIRRAAELE